MNLELFQININNSIRAALKQIEDNHHGIILIVDENDAVVGLATDGDIRRALLEGKILDDCINTCYNAEFAWAHINTPREQLLKQLDHNIRVLPLLDANRKLSGIVSRDHIPELAEEQVYARSMAPVRISFGGGGSDLTHYFIDSGGAVINATISLYSHATLKLRLDEQVIIHSRDIKDTLHAPDLKEALKQPGKFGLILAVLRTINPDHGFELSLHSDFPMKSGLGGSAVVAASILGCFNQFRRDKWDLYEMAELAYQAERLYLGIAGGWQDQYATIFGGVNFMEFRAEQNVIQPLRIESNTLLELEECLLLCDTGTIHESGEVHHDQRDEMKRSEVRDLVNKNVELTYQIRNQLLRGKLNDFAKSLNTAWQYKKQFSQRITNTELNDIYDVAMANGAMGGKLLGAGGGGFFLFFVSAARKFELISALEKIGKNIKPFRFESQGIKSWTVREEKNL